MAHILVVDDNEDVRELMAMLMTRDGHECTTCSSAEEAEALFACWQPDLAILDIHLPQRHGVELCWRLHRQYGHVPIVIMSAMLSEWEVDDLRDCGADAILEKGCDSTFLMTTVNGLLLDVYATKGTD